MFGKIEKITFATVLTFAPFTVNERKKDITQSKVPAVEAALCPLTMAVTQMTKLKIQSPYKKHQMKIKNGLELGNTLKLVITATSAD